VAVFVLFSERGRVHISVQLRILEQDL